MPQNQNPQHDQDDALPARDLIVSMRGATKEYVTQAGSVTALRQGHLELRSGECLAVVGPSGSGKSTLLGIVGGLVQPDQILDLVVCGVRWSVMSASARASARRQHVAFIHQGLNLVGFMSVEENVMLPLLLNGERSRRARARASEALDQLGLTGTQQRKPRELSGGQQQRVAIARAMAAAQPLLLADEPTGALDTDTSRVVFGAIREHARRQGGAIIVSHDPLATEFADRTVKILDGSVVN